MVVGGIITVEGGIIVVVGGIIIVVGGIIIVVGIINIVVGGCLQFPSSKIRLPLHFIHFCSSSFSEY